MIYTVSNRDGAEAPSFCVRDPGERDPRALCQEEQEAGVCRDRGGGLWSGSSHGTEIGKHERSATSAASR